MTKRDKHKIDEVFSGGLRGHEVLPPAGIWEGIQSGLNTRKKRRLLPVYMRVAATLGILGLIGLGYYYTGRFHEPGLTLQPLSEPGTVLSDSLRASEKSPSPVQKVEERNLEEKRIQGSGVSVSLEKRGKTPESGIQEKDPSTGEKTGATLLKIKITRESGLPKRLMPGGVQNDRIPGKDPVEKVYTWADLGSVGETEVEEKEEKRFSIAAMASPIYSYRSLGEKNSELSQYLSEAENGKISYSGGFDLGWVAGDRLSFHTGLVYARMGIGVSKVYSPYDRVAYIDDFEQVSGNAQALIVSNSTGVIRDGGPGTESEFISSNSTNKLSIEDGRPVFTEEYTGVTSNSPELLPAGGRVDQFFHFLEVPFMLRYTIVDRKTDVKLLGGISTNFLLGSRVYYIEAGNSREIGTVDELRSVNYSGNLGLGIDMELSRALEFLIEPQLKYYLNSINGSDNFVESRPYSFGLYTGFRYRF